MLINNLTVIYLRFSYFKKSFAARGFRLEWTRFTFAVNSLSGNGSAVVVSNCYQLSLNNFSVISQSRKWSLQSIYLLICLLLWFLWCYWILASLETQGQIVGARESLNGRKNMARRKVKNGEKSPWGQCLTRPVPNGRRGSGFWLVPENFFFSGTNQKPERLLLPHN